VPPFRSKAGQNVLERGYDPTMAGRSASSSRAATSGRAKWLRRLELLPRDEPGFWERYGYHNDAD
jgi:hypothetical protein